MSDNKTHDAAHLDAAPQSPATLDTFEVSTCQSVSQPDEQLLAHYAEPVVMDSTMDPTVMDPAILDSAATEIPADSPIVVDEVVDRPIEQPSISRQDRADPVSHKVDSAVAQPAEAQLSEAQLSEAQPTDAPADVTQPTDAQAAVASASQSPTSLPEPSAPAAGKAKSKSKAKPAAENSDGKSSPAKEPAPEPNFDNLSLSQPVQQAVKMSGYDTPTAIQAEIIPHMLAGRDLLAQSQTGTGKTAAFALPILSRIKKSGPKPQVLVLAPTRELAIQVSKSFTTYAACLPNFSVAAIYGGQDYEAQFKQLRRGVNVVVGTPGRVIDHVNRGTLDLSGVECLVLDEADEMLNMGFLEDVQFVLDKTPDGRQIALFSATLPGPIRTIAQRYLNDPAKVTIKKKTMTAESIRQRALFVAPRDKIDVLTRILEAEVTDGVIVFTKTKDATVSVAEKLQREGLSAVALNGDMPQKVRERTIEQLKSGKLDILVATDVAARGLDVTRVSHVFNYDLPHDSESYIHRVGRTGRAGRKGEAVIFLTNAQRGKLRLIERATKQPIEVVQPPTADDINAKRVEQFSQCITDMMAQQDLTMFKEMITTYAEESGKPMVMIAAALAQISQQGRPFLKKDRPQREMHDRDDRRENGSRHERFERGGSDGFSQHPRRNGAGEGRTLGPVKTGMVRYRLEVGRKDGVKPGNIVGAVANEAGIDGEFIGPIRIHDSFSTVDLPEGMPRDIYQTLQQTRVSGKPLRLSVAKDDRGSDRSHHGKGPRHDKPRGKKIRSSKVGGKAPHAAKHKKRKAKA